MQVEIRADGVHIEGYVNVPGRESKPVITSKGQKVIEVIEPRAFQRAIDKSSNISATLDHNKSRVLAQTSDGTLELREDSVGLRAKTIITDPEVVEAAKQRKLKGWSFGMTKILDKIEERAGELPLRKVMDFSLDHVTIVLHKNPAYAATSIEMRTDDEPEEIETRADDCEINFADMVGTPKKQVDLLKYQNRINKLKVGK
ncbi:MAG: peptidase [Herbinix sp.]|jgi:HK97 family phage prohead protease|nr:peptidase [Herbinix sp.]